MMLGEGRLAPRSLADQPRSQQLRAAPRLRLVGDAVDGRPRRLRHQLRPLPPRRRREHPADQRTAGRQRRRRPDRPARSVVPDDAAGLPGRICGSVASSIRWRRTSPTCPRTTIRAGSQSYFISVQREVARNMIVDVAYVGNRADDLLLFANYNQADAEQCRRNDSSPDAAADCRVRRHHLRLQRRQVALRQPAGQVQLPPARRD